RAVYFSEAQRAAIQSLGLTSDGVGLTMELTNNGQSLVASKPGAGETVFTVELSDVAGGSYVFTLVGNLDHPTPAVGTDNEEDVSLTFGFTARDSDGDTVTSSFGVAVNDDSPLFSAQPVNVSPDEENVPGLGGNVGDSYAGTSQ